MKFNNEFMNNVEKNIIDMINDVDILDNTDTLSKLEKLLSIYNCINNINVQEQQLEMFKQSQAMIKNVDLSNVDVNGFLNKFMGK